MRKQILAVALLATFLSACAHRPHRSYVRVGPPGSRVEVIATAPGDGYVWIPGYHAWRGNEYVWVGGHWERPPQARYRQWVPGHWHESRNGWYWTEGRWQ